MSYHKVQQELQPKDANTFKTLIKLYEQKNYKKGLKTSEALLKSVPNHGETMSLRAIFLYSSGKLEEGQTLAKKALDGNMKSDICWHIYGIIHRSERNYKEAVKCYKFALMLNPSNIQILRDLAVLQIQIRDIEGHAETRYKLLKNKESLVINWVAYAVGEHLKGDYEQTIKLIDSIKKITQGDQLKKFERSELCIYEAFVFFEAKEYQKCIDVLTENSKDITDRCIKRELIIKSYLALNEHEKAYTFIDELIELNQNNGKYHQLYFEVKKATTPEKIVEEGKNLLQQYPRSQTLKLTILRNTSVSEFKQVFLDYIIPYFQRSQPSIFNEIIGFYKENRQEYIKIIGEVLLENLQNLEKNKKFVGKDQIELPNVLLWNYMVYAQHLDRIGNQKDALEYINKAINHTPTLIELYLIKAKIYKHMYNYLEAYYQTEKARNMDQADRYLNNKCIKYVLRINRVQEAEALMRLFLRDAQDGNAHDLQTLWFEIALGNAHLKLKEKGAAMKQYKFIEKHFSDMYEDQFDFHTYAMRKYNLKSYIEMIRYQDTLCNTKYYISAAVPMIYSLLKHNNLLQDKLEEEKKEEEIMKNMNSKEKKAYKRDKDKALAKKQKESEERKKKDPFYEQRSKLDLDGVQYLEKLTDPLEEAQHFAEKIINVDIKDSKLADSAYPALIDLQIVRNKPLIVLKMLSKLIKFGGDKTITHIKTVQVLQYAQKLVSDKSVEDVVLESIQEEIKNLSSGKDIEALNAEFLKTIENKVEQALVRERIALELKQIDNHKFAENLELIIKDNISTLSLKQAVEIYDYLAKIQESVKQEVKEQLNKQFPDSDYFGEYQNLPISEIQKEKEQRQKA